MHWALSRTSRSMLEQVACATVLVALDFDGTLAPIVDDPDAARMRASTRALLAAVAKRYPCVVVSGRSRGDVARRVAGCGVASVVGNHGVEPSTDAARSARLVQRWSPRVRSALRDVPGVVVEDKTYSLAVHYRASHAKKAARATILAALSALPDARIVGGKAVLNAVPEGAPHKGIAVVRERARLGCHTAIYVGDDDTDEDVFAMQRPGELLTIRVGPRRTSLAAYYLRDQREVDALLRVLVALRRAPSGRSA